MVSNVSIISIVNSNNNNDRLKKKLYACEIVSRPTTSNQLDYVIYIFAI